MSAFGEGFYIVIAHTVADSSSPTPQPLSSCRSPSHKPDGKRRVRADMMSEFSSGLMTPAGRGEKRKAAASKNLSASKKRRKGHAR